jgi:hypothetical protein
MYAEFSKDNSNFLSLILISLENAILVVFFVFYFKQLSTISSEIESTNDKKSFEFNWNKFFIPVRNIKSNWWNFPFNISLDSSINLKTDCDWLYI